MKFTINIEATPEEARTFMGLPDVAPMQEAMMKEIEAKMTKNIKDLDPETMMKTWMPLMVEGWGEMQKAFWGQMGMNPMGMGGETEKKKA